MGARETAPTYVTEDMEAHPFVCPASRCTYGSTGHVTKAYVIQINLKFILSLRCVFSGCTVTSRPHCTAQGRAGIFGEGEQPTAVTCNYKRLAERNSQTDRWAVFH